ncbi:MAG: hypothetical protein V7638_1377 [Acidobacteriota bacterium]
MTKHLTKSLIDLRGLSLTAQPVAELRLDHTECRFDITSLVVALKKDLAVDSSGFSTCRFVQWVKAKYTNPRMLEARDWVKVSPDVRRDDEHRYGSNDHRPLC